MNMMTAGRETFLRETYPDEASAMNGRCKVREGLLKSGGWTAVAQAAVGMSST